MALLGRSGSGKSTFLRVLGALDKEVEGYIRVQRRRAVVFHDPRLMPWLPVLFFEARGARKRGSGLLAIFLVVACLAGFTATTPVASQDRKATDLAAQLAAAVPPRTRLIVAEQQSQASAVWALSGVDKSLPYAITFANFNGGSAVLEALISGAVDIGYIGEAPLPIAIGAGVKDLVAIAIYANPGSPENYYLVAQPDRGIKAVADLKGRTVAYPPGSGRHMVLASILHANGLDLGASSVKGVPLAGTEVAPSFASRSVDAAIVVGGQYFRIGKPPIIADGHGHNWGVNVILTRKALLDDPAKTAAIADFVRRAVAFYNWQGANPDAWIRASYVKQEGLTFEQGKWLDDAAGHGATRSMRSPSRSSSRSRMACSPPARSNRESTLRHMSMAGSTRLSPGRTTPTA